MVQPGEKEFLFQKHIQKQKRYIQVNILLVILMYHTILENE